MDEQESIIGHGPGFFAFGQGEIPIHSFYRFKVYTLGGLSNSTDNQVFKYQIEGTGIKVIVSFNISNESCIVRYMRSKQSDYELSQILVRYWTKYWREHLLPPSNKHFKFLMHSLK